MKTLIVSVLVVMLVGVWWVFVLWLLSELSGWRKLAAVYRAERPPSGRRLSMQGGWVGSTLYGAVSRFTHHTRDYTSPSGPFFAFASRRSSFPGVPFTMLGRRGGFFLALSSLISVRHASALCASYLTFSVMHQRLTNRCSQPLTCLQPQFCMTKTHSFQIGLAAAGGG